MPLILGTNSIKDTGYDVANSLRFNNGSSDYLNRTLGTPTNNDICTLSLWVKKTGSSNHSIWSNGSSNADETNFVFQESGKIEFKEDVSSSATFQLITNRVFRDLSAWYHFVIAFDTTQGTSSNRVKLYINGTQETSFSTETYPSQNTNVSINSNIAQYIGRRNRLTDQYFDGYMAEVVFIDGQQLDPTSFGEFDSDSPTIWKPKDVSGLTFGNNGFYLDFENASSLGADVSGNSNNFTVNNLTSVDQSTDTCTNNFATINILDNESSNITISEGNLNYTVSGGTDETNRATFGFTKGKWYFESKYVDDANYIDVGVGSASDLDIATPRFHMEMAGYYMIQISTSSTKVFDNGSLIATLSSNAQDDIHMYAIDMDNNKFYAGKNGSWYSSGDPANNSNPLISMDDGYTTLMPSVCSKSSSVASLNFGSPSYSISSGNSDANGYGNFEYAVPSGYYSLNTKNLSEFG